MAQVEMNQRMEKRDKMRREMTLVEGHGPRERTRTHAHTDARTRARTITYGHARAYAHARTRHTHTPLRARRQGKCASIIATSPAPQYLFSSE